jgi:nucleoside-diphosphate-sugar epimerase
MNVLVAGATGAIGRPLAAAVGWTGRSVPVLFQFAEPDVAVADWMVVVL